ncbi:hypothetical protein FQA39_LY01039 [Lamprigera yunnana]|nr:hypothetical protein FQA39_LY01039 [Lamprigera yunnana]
MLSKVPKVKENLYIALLAQILCYFNMNSESKMLLYLVLVCFLVHQNNASTIKPTFHIEAFTNKGFPTTTTTTTTTSIPTTDTTTKKPTTGTTSKPPTTVTATTTTENEPYLEYAIDIDLSKDQIHIKKFKKEAHSQ